MVDKIKVENCFRKSIDTYNANATVQEKICSNLMELLYCPKHDKVLEIGCGTGFLTQAFLQKYSPKKYIANDLVADSKISVKKIFERMPNIDFSFVSGDAEKVEFESSNDLIISASTVQWFDNLPRFLQKAYNLLSPGGVLIFSTFGTDNLNEIRSACNSGLKYFSEKEIYDMVAEKFSVLEIKEEHHYLSFPKPLSVLRHMKLTGVNGNNKKIWQAKDFTEFDKKYRMLSKNQNDVTLTYNPVYVVAIKE
ncbi:MAG: malonyl-ACP O-methyltransferase BioC [Bacteroidota bacterium]|nr:malonyl-ACP O-methyltransferase BioC [Bacteroidota bacterium]